MGNGSASTGDGDGRRIRGAGGKGDVGSAAARNSLSHRIDVCRVVRAGEQGRKRDVFALKAGLVGVKNVSVIGR